MRVFGLLLLVVAGLCFVGAFGMDTSVATIDGKRIHNIGLMRSQENVILLGIGLLITGGIFIAWGGRTQPALAETTNHSKLDQKKCPFCAESIKKEAIVCRFCGKDQPAVQSNSRQPSVYEIDNAQIVLRRLGHQVEKEESGEWTIKYKSGAIARAPSDLDLVRLSLVVHRNSIN